jgi:hypothetical protein
MQSIYGITRKKLESYFEEMGEKNIELPKFLNGFIEEK